jgi:hypothetical protein
MAGSLSVRKKNAEAAQRRRFEARRAERLRANEAATANTGKLGSGIASIPGRVVNYIKSSSPSSVARDVKGIARATYDAAVEDPNAFAEDAIFSPLAAIRDFGDVRETARKLRAQGRDAEAEKMEAMAGTAVLSAVPILGRPAGVATRKAIKAAEKTAIKGAKKAATPSRFEAASKAPVVSQAGRMGVPVIGREQMAVQHPSKFGPYATIKPRRPESEVEITREPSVNMAPSEVFDIEKLQNSLVVPLYGDKSIAGERITSINDTPVSVETYGGPRYGALNAAVGSPSGWASELPQISALRNQIRGGLEQGRDVYGVYTAMSPRAADQTTMMADALLQQAQQAPIRKADVKAFDEAARQIVPNFAGILHPEAYQQLLGAKQGQRKSLVELMDTAKALEAGLPDVSATRMALTTPELMYAPGGSTGFQVVKFGPESLEPVDVSLVHPTYGTQMAGTPVGHFEQQIPFDMLYPDLIKERRALGLSPGKDLRSFEFRKPTQVVDQETLDLVMKYLQDTQGAE